MEEIRRVRRSKEQAKISYNKLSKKYDFFVSGMEKKFRDSGLRKLGVHEGEMVLEVGFGTGYCTEALARSVGRSGKVHGIDISEGMKDITASRLQNAGLSERAELKCGDAMDLPYIDNNFDAIFISFALELFDNPDISVVLQEFRRVLKSNGRIGIVAMSKEGKAGMMVRFYEWAHKTFPKYIDCRPIYVRQALETEKFRIVDETKMSLMNVPVSIILAKK